MYEWSLLPAAWIISARRGWAKAATSTIAKPAPPQIRHFCFCLEGADSEIFAVPLETVISGAETPLGEERISKVGGGERK
jgi:hypothetical protein